jgi:hypothetical protein
LLASRTVDISASIYTQITDVERECDGFLNYDRTYKFNVDDMKKVVDINTKLTQSQS